MENPFDLKGRVALVTGAGQGVGRQVALHFAAFNAGVILVNDFYLDRAQAVVEEIVAMGGKAEALAFDVGDHGAVCAAIDGASARHGAVEILVNNAGNFGPAVRDDTFTPFWECGPEAWRAWVDVNFWGVVNCCAAVIPAMIERRYGRLVTIISDAGRNGEAEIIYSGAKAGAAGLMRGIARTLGRHMITANSISIAAMASPTVEKMIAEMPPERWKRILEKYVIRRQGRPTDVANAVMLLASDAGEWITGQTYPVNGGFTFNQ